MVRRYVKKGSSNEIIAPSGYYQPLGEELLDYKGRQVLALVGFVDIQSACCGGRSYNYVRVEGFVAETDSEGYKVEPITSEDQKHEIDALIRQKYPAAVVVFA